MRTKNIPGLFLCGAALVYSQETISLADRRELMLDRYLIAQMNNCELTLQEPHDEGMVLAFDNPWEGSFCGYCTVIKDTAVYRLYYRGLPSAKREDDHRAVTCYAESGDGVHWTKPHLGLYHINGSLENNVILAESTPATHNFSPFLDSKPGTPRTERFKALAGSEKSGLLAFVSADGIHWQRQGEEPVIQDGMFDSQNVSFWSKSEGCYVCYFRTWTRTGYSGFRSVSRSTSPDFLHWSAAQPMSYGDTPQEHIYINQTHPYFNAPHIYLAVAARFMPNKQVLTDEQARQIQVDPKYFKDCSDVVLMSSRGGNVYGRTFMEAFIVPGIGWSNWVSRSNYPALNIVPTGDNEMSVYVNQNYAQPTACIHRYSMRLDGLAALSAGYHGGEMITKPFTFSGNRLAVNFRTSAAGHMRVEIRNQTNEPIKGFTLQESQVMVGNEINRIVQWNGSSMVKNLAGQVIRLRFELRDADLFALQFVN